MPRPPTTYQRNSTSQRHQFPKCVKFGVASPWIVRVAKEWFRHYWRAKRINSLALASLSRKSRHAQRWLFTVLQLLLWKPDSQRTATYPIVNKYSQIILLYSSPAQPVAWSIAWSVQRDLNTQLPLSTADLCKPEGCSSYHTLCVTHNKYEHHKRPAIKLFEMA